MLKLARIIPMIAVAILLFAGTATAQKAEPLRIKFAKGKFAATVSNTLANGEEMDYVIGVRKGQEVTLKVTSSGGDLFDFTVMGDGIDFETDEESYTEYSFIAPETGDYLIFVRKKSDDAMPKAKFSLEVSAR